MDMMLKGKNAAIVGATRGIGRAIAELLAAEGCNVSICARGAEGVENAVKDLKRHNVMAIGTALDAVHSAAQTSWINQSADTLGGLDIFIANVSALNLGEDEHAWRHSFEVDMMATFNGADAALPHLKKSNAAAMVFISSISALHTPLGAKPYGAMKAAVINYASGLARSLAPEGVRVNTVSPGNIYFNGGVWAQIERDSPEFFEKQLNSNPMGRMGTAEEVANAAVFLASPAASYISGTNLLVDGAMTQGVQY